MLVKGARFHSGIKYGAPVLPVVVQLPPLSPAGPQTFSFVLFRSLYFTLFSPSTGDEELYIQQAVVFIEDAIKVREQNFVKSSTLSSSMIPALWELLESNPAGKHCPHTCRQNKTPVDYYLYSSILPDYSTAPSTTEWMQAPSACIDGTTLG